MMKATCTRLSPLPSAADPLSTQKHRKRTPMKKRFTLTFSITTEVSASNGDHAYSGFVTCDGEMPRKRHYIPKHPAQFTLREAVAILDDHSFSEGVHADSCPWSQSSPPRWITFSDGWNSSNGESLEVSIHPAKRGNITSSSMCRLARLFGAYGEKRREPATL